MQNVSREKLKYSEFNFLVSKNKGTIEILKIKVVPVKTLLKLNKKELKKNGIKGSIVNCSTGEELYK